MRFKTTIQLVSDAQDKSEALDLVEEYLAGNIVSGVDMRCVTKPVYKSNIVCVAAISLAIVTGILVGSHIKHPQNMIQTIPGTSAIQSPLKTSDITHSKPEFKKEWQDRQTKEALDQISR
ncbi:MAG: hypothetical protein NTY76_03125 [Candidatus Omnitrophica bacterium]|nr:hypothetical protein [Candidatus Omnitrophota bacterium]